MNVRSFLLALAFLVHVLLDCSSLKPVSAMMLLPCVLSIYKCTTVSG